MSEGYRGRARARRPRSAATTATSRLCRKHFFDRLKEGEARQLSLGLPRTA